MDFKALTNSFKPKKPNIVTTVEYQKWREVIFAVTPEQVDVAQSDANRVYGVIMDIGPARSPKFSRLGHLFERISDGRSIFSSYARRRCHRSGRRSQSGSGGQGNCRNRTNVC